jgi:hypothetical protein
MLSLFLRIMGRVSDVVDNVLYHVPSTFQECAYGGCVMEESLPKSLEGVAAVHFEK